MDDIERQRKHFENVSGEYFRARQDVNHLTLKRLLWGEFFSGRKTIFGESIRVVEPMCGYSEGRRILLENLDVRLEYAGFDFSRPLVEEARQLYPNDDIWVQDVTKWEARQSFDVAILIGGLHHVYSHTPDVLNRIFCALGPGGYFINFEPTQDNALFRLIRSRIYKKNRIFDAETERAFDLHELNCHYRDAGFEIVDQLYPGLLAYVLYYNPDAFPGLNVGGKSWVEAIFRMERGLYRSVLARKLSFATLSLLRKP